MEKEGFSLIELLIAIAIVAIIAAITVPSYQSYIKQANRQAAEQLMLQDIQYMERWYSENGTYINHNAWPVLPFTVAPETGDATYTISFSSISPNATSYNLIAQPKCNTVQANDGCICIDKDTNITESAPIDCSNSGIQCECIP